MNLISVIYFLFSFIAIIVMIAKLNQEQTKINKILEIISDSGYSNQAYTPSEALDAIEKILEENEKLNK